MKLVLQSLFPFLVWLPRVSRESLRADFIAGLTGAVIVLPQGIAFATIAGLPPEYGLYTAMVTPIIAALFGSSRHLISGPTTAISLVVFSTINQHAVPGTPEFISLALTLTFLAGLFQLISGVLHLGTLINFVSHTVVIGFTAGAALLIATSQLKYVLGIDLESGAAFAHVWMDIFESLHEINYSVVFVSLATVGIALAAKYVRPSIPHLLLGMVAGSIVAEAIGGQSAGLQMVGSIPGHLPPLSSPDLTISTVQKLGSSAFAIALLGLIEAVSIARSIATHSHQRIDANREFLGQGLSNIVGSFFSSYAGSGSFTRSGVNYSSGAKTPLSAVFAALLLMLVVMLVAPLLAHLPNAAMGGVILLVAYQLIDFRGVWRIIKVSHTETAILFLTFFATLFLELEFAIYLGVLLSLMDYLRTTSMPEVVTLAPNPAAPKKVLTNVRHIALDQCPQLKIVRIDGSVFFGSVNYVQHKIRQISGNEGIKHILINCPSISLIDYAGAEMLVEEAKRLQSIGGGLYFTTTRSRVLEYLRKGGFLEDIGEENFFISKTRAINTIFERLSPPICSGCTKRIFRECLKKQSDE